MEGQRVYGPDVVHVIDRLAVALERVLFFLHGWRWVEVFDGYATLDGRRGVPWKVKKEGLKMELLYE